MLKMPIWLLLPMGFGDECAQTERTSFKTSFLITSHFKSDLSSGTGYCSAVRAAREFDAENVVLHPTQQVVLLLFWT